MKVLLVSAKTVNSLGGIGVWTNLYLSLCSKNGIDCDLVNTSVIGKRAINSTAKRNFNDERLRTKHIFNQLNRFIDCDNANYDVAHINTSCGTFGLIRDYMTAKRIKRKGIKTVVHYHCAIDYQVKGCFGRFFLKKLLKYSDINLVLNDKSQNYLMKRFGVKSEKIPNFTIDNVILTGEKDIKDNISNIVFVGRVEEEKGYSQMVEMANRFSDIAFTLVGEIDVKLDVSRAPKNMNFVGTVGFLKVIENLDNADLFIFPSKSEGFSMALMESMARGVPCVASDVGANRDMLEEKGGIIVGVNDNDALEQAIIKLQDKSLRTEMSKWNIQKVINDYSSEKNFERLLRIYNSDVN